MIEYRKDITTEDELMLWYNKGETLLKEIKEKNLPENMLAFWYIGQMGMVIKWKRKIIYLDPVLSDLVDQDGNSRRHYEIPYEPTNTQVDYIFCTHDHRDHMNQETILGMLKANPKAIIVIPAPLKNILLSWGVKEEQILPLHQNESISLDKQIRVTGIETAHDTYRYDEHNLSFTLGYVFNFAGLKLFHSGDTMLTNELLESLQSYSPIHTLMLPINGSDIIRDSKNIIGNMNAKDAVLLTSQLDAKLTIPLHYDMVYGNEENPLIFADYMERIAPNKRYHIMRLGEMFLIG